MRSRKTWWRAAVATLVGTCVAIVPTGAAQAGVDHPVVIAGFAYTPAVTVALQGDTMSASNLDPVPHNIVSIDTNPATGRPYFRSELDGFYIGRDVPGVSSTPPGAYLYTCDLHAFMVGVLVVV